MLYSCTHMATVGIRGLCCAILHAYYYYIMPGVDEQWELCAVR